jgi:four helix bundle protein
MDSLHDGQNGISADGSKVTRFEDLVAWQKARALSSAVYHATNQGSFQRDFELRNQIRGSAISVASNISEGFERGSRGEFHQFLSTAKGSCAEVRTQLYLALDVGHLDRETFDALMTQAEEVARIVGGLRAAVARQRAAQNNNPPTKR